MKRVWLLTAAIAATTTQAQQYYGKGYTIIAPEQGSDDLSSVVYRTLPAGNVQTALEYLLAGTGWQLADAYAADPMIFRLYSQTLPEQKRQLGPIALDEALSWIGGPAWRLVVDPVNKRISYEVKAPYRESRRALPVSANTSLSPKPNTMLNNVVITDLAQDTLITSTDTPSPVEKQVDVSALRIFVPLNATPQSKQTVWHALTDVAPRVVSDSSKSK